MKQREEMADLEVQANSNYFSNYFKNWAEQHSAFKPGWMEAGQWPYSATAANVEERMKKMIEEREKEIEKKVDKFLYFNGKRVGEVVLDPVNGEKYVYIKKEAFDTLRWWLPQAKRLTLKKVVRNGPATVFFWSDDSKTILKLQEGDTPDDFAAFCIAFCKKKFGSISAIRRALKKAETVEQ